MTTLSIYGILNNLATDKAKLLASMKGFKYKFIDVNKDKEGRDFLLQNNHNDIPTIYQGDSLVGSLEDFHKNINKPTKGV